MLRETFSCMATNGLLAATSLFGVTRGGHNFYDHAFLFVGQLGQMHAIVLVVGLIALGPLVYGERRRHRLQAVYPERP